MIWDHNFHKNFHYLLALIYLSLISLIIWGYFFCQKYKMYFQISYKHHNLYEIHLFDFDFQIYEVI
ncbi:hypothetical protein ASE55_19730 [Chryseobacterium sp. Leaf201]|nr:hypothetical protein ASE55_19730 [Chryseobacterium sp. Leaf201]